MNTLTGPDQAEIGTLIGRRLRKTPRRRVLVAFLGLLLIQIVSTPAASQEPPGPQATCVDLNTASAAQLERIVQIGPARAQQILALRKERPFRSVDELVRVNGIAAARLAAIKAQGLACVRAAPAPGVQSAANVPPAKASTDSTRTRQSTAGCVDINTAAAQELQRIVQIGPARAQQIIDLRKQRRFGSVDELTRVNGIGAARVAEIKAQGLACVR